MDRHTTTVWSCKAKVVCLQIVAIGHSLRYCKFVSEAILRLKRNNSVTLVPLHDLFEVFDIHIKIITAIFSILALRALKFGLALGKTLFFMTKAMVGRVKANSNASNRQTRPQIR